MREYKVWSRGLPPEIIEAETGWEARKAFAAKHLLDVTDCLCTLIYPGDI